MRSQLAGGCVGVNPHVVVRSDLATIPFEEWGRPRNRSSISGQTNVHFLQVHSRSQLEIRVWERGAGPTPPVVGSLRHPVAAVL